MFNNLSKREKTLATVVLGLLPVIVLFMTVMWFNNAYFANQATINSLNKQISDQERKQIDAILANQRRLFYRAMSMPTDFNKAKIDYEDWLGNLVRDELKMTFRNLKPLPAEQKRFTGGRTMETVFVSHPYSLRFDCTLDQLTRFLHEFSKLDLLQRITSISITPRAAGTTGEDKKIRTGKLSIEMKIDVISLVDADETRDFVVAQREPEKTLEYYDDQIVTRNIFGPANNVPTLSLSRSRSVTAGSDIAFTLSGKDADRSDQLQFELLESPIEDAKVSQTSSTSRSAKFECPALEAGEYGPFKVRVTDNGYPPKSTESEFVLNVRERRVSAPPPKKPEFKHAGETAITGIVQEKTGDWKVFVWIKTLGKKYQLKQGESFELDKSEWLVATITPKSVTLQRDDRLLTYGVGDLLTEPTDTTTVSADKEDTDHPRP